MLNFTQFLIEASLMKVDALLRMHPSAGLQPGYVAVNDFLGPRGSNEVVAMGMQVLDAIKAHQVVPPPAEYITTAKLVPTQYAIYLDDVKDIARKQNFDKPIQVVRWRNKMMVINGHHRACAAAIVGREKILAQVIDAPACFAKAAHHG